jgi:hypothetical protein
MKADKRPYVPDWRKALKAANAAPRCGAKKRRKGTPCGSPAMANGRCRIHGGLSTGPKTAKGIENIRRTHWKHGQRSAEAIRQRKEGMALRREIKRLGEMADKIIVGGCIRSDKFNV